MKRIISIFLSMLMLVTAISAVDLSSLAADSVTAIDFVFTAPYARGSVTIGKFVREKQGNKLVLSYSDDKQEEYVCKYKDGKKAFYTEDGKCVEGKDIELSYDTLSIGSNTVTITYNGISKDVNLDCIENNASAIDFTFAPDVAITERADGNYYSDIVEQMNHVGNKLVISYTDGVKKEYNCVYDKDARANIFVDSDYNELLIKKLNVSNELTEIKAGADNVIRIFAFDFKLYCDTNINVSHAKKEVVNKKSATCTAKGYTGDTVCSICGYVFKKGKSTDKLEHKYKISKATLTTNGKNKCEKCGKVKKTYYYPKTIKLKKTSFVYDGKQHKPAVVIKDSKGKVISADNYKVKYPSGMKKVGEYKVKVTFKGSYYKGTKTLTYTIVPKATEIKSIEPKSKSFIISWKKVSSQITGYQIQCSTSSKFKSPKAYVVEDTKKSTIAVGGLKGNKKYYVRMRTYKTINGTRIYSAWSNTKTVTTKK